MHSLILAKLAGNPDFDTLAARYLDESGSWQPVDQKKLADCVKHLKNLAK
jgi:hypothetical protein